MRALTLDRERHDTLNVHATHARSLIKYIKNEKSREPEGVSTHAGVRVNCDTSFFDGFLRMSYTASEVMSVYDTH